MVILSGAVSRAATDGAVEGPHACCSQASARQGIPGLSSAEVPIYSSVMKIEFRIRFFWLLCAIAASLLCTFSSASGQAAPDSRAATVYDSMPHAKQIDQVAISPDGVHVAYIANDELSVISLSGGPARPIGVEGKLPLREVS